MPVFLLATCLLLGGCGLDPLTTATDDTGTDTSTTGPVSFGSLTVTPGSLNFGDVEVNTQAEATLTLSNSADEPISLVSAVVDIGEAYTLTDITADLPSELDVDEEMVITIRFEPSDTETYQDVIDLQVAGELYPASITMDGTGVIDTGGGTGTGTGGTTTTGGGTSSAGITASPSSITFTAVEVGAQGSKQLSVTNPSADDVLIDSWSCSDSVFSYDQAGELDPPEMLYAGETKVLTVLFTPTDVVTSTATCTLTTDSSVTPSLDFPVSGEGLEPACTVCFPILTVNTGGSSNTQVELASAFGIPATQSITIRNESDVDLTITGHDLDQTLALTGNFSVSGLNPTTLSAWSSTSATIEYTCREKLCLDFGYLHIYSDASNTTDYVLDLLGSGLAGM